MYGEREIQKAYESILGHDFEKAIEWFEKAIAAEPDNAAYHYKLSITYARSNRLQKAAEHAAKAIELEPGREDYRYHLRNLRARELASEAQRRFDEPEPQIDDAVILLQEAIQLDPLLVEAYLLLGAAYAQLQDYDSAMKAMQDAIRLDPQNEIAKQHQKQYRQKMNS